jgi:hypothetical protein
MTTGQQLFDLANKHGLEPAGSTALETARLAGVDGDLGPHTIDAANQAAAKTSTLKTALSSMLDIREARYRSLAAAKPVFKKFLHGWINRSEDLRKLLGIA